MLLPAIEFIVRANPNAGRILEHLKASHTPVADVGRIATEAGVKTLVLSHFVPANSPRKSQIRIGSMASAKLGRANWCWPKT